MSEHSTADEPYLLVEEVAERLGLPLSVLLHRVEAGDIPARRVERADGLHYALRLGDLGIDLDDEKAHAPAPALDEETLTTVFEPAEPSVESAIVSAFNSGPEPLPAPVWAARPREPQQPPPWLVQGAGLAEAAGLDDERESREPAGDDSEHPGGYQPVEAGAVDEYAFDEERGAPEIAVFGAPEDDTDIREEPALAELAVPPPSRGPVGILDAPTTGPRGDLASMSLDARELVAGLLDRWERTLEQRIYTEQRQRFQAELVARQNMVKQLQMELHTARAEHAAAQAEKDRILAGKERELADRERDLADTRRIADEAERVSSRVASSRRRRWFWSRDD